MTSKPCPCLKEASHERGDTGPHLGAVVANLGSEPAGRQQYKRQCGLIVRVQSLLPDGWG